MGELYLRLPCTVALALGSTCRMLQQLLQPLRSAKIEQYLKSDNDLAPEMQMDAFDWRPAYIGVPEGYVKLYFSWTVRASRILYHLVLTEKILPEVVWAAIVPQISMPEQGRYFTVRCSFGCLDWVYGSMQFNGSQAFLYQRLAHSDLARLDFTFSRLRDIYVLKGIPGDRVFIHLCKNEPDFTQQQNAALIAYWASGVVKADVNM